MNAGFALLPSEMNGKIDELRSDMLAAMSSSQADTMKWMIRLLLVQGGSIVGVLRLLPAH